MKVDLNPSLRVLRGTFNDWVYRTVNGRVVVSPRPKPTEREPSATQLAQRKRFAYAMSYAQEVLSNPCQREWYEELARSQNRRADKIVAADYLTLPEVRRIDLSEYRGQPGGIVRVIAVDDVEVVGVRLSMRLAAGALLEEGAAMKIHGVWCYTATQAAPIGESVNLTATAIDRPGNEASATVAYPSAADAGAGR